MGKKTGRDFFREWKRVVNFCVFVSSCFPRSVNLFFWNLITPMPGKAFLLLRYVLIRNLAAECGDNVTIHHNVFIGGFEKIKFGSNVSIHTGCYLDATGGVSLGNNVSIAHHSSILSANHTWDEEDLPIKYNPIVLSPVFVSDDVWIACGCRILAGVSLGRRSVVAAGAVVCRDVDSSTLVGGIPARLIKKI